jgi:hypothetical protein
MEKLAKTPQSAQDTGKNIQSKAASIGTGA